MTKVVVRLPEPKREYSEDNQRQILRAVDTIKTELNFSYQDDLRKELERFTWFNTRFGC